MITLERKMYLISIVSTIVAVLSLIFAWVAYDASWQIAERSGSFDRAELVVGIGGSSLSQRQRNFVIVGGEQFSSKNALAIGAIPFTFHSSGKKPLSH